jgi:hypothetical protein
VGLGRRRSAVAVAGLRGPRGLTGGRDPGSGGRRLPMGTGQEDWSLEPGGVAESGGASWPVAAGLCAAAPLPAGYGERASG